MDEEALYNAMMLAGLGAMGSRGSAWDKLAQAGMFGLQGYNNTLTAREQAKLQKAKLEEEAQQREMRQMQIDQARAAMADQQRQREMRQTELDAAARAFAPGVTPLTAVDDEGNAMPSTPGGGGMREYVGALWQTNPDKAIALQQSMAKESPWAKIDPSKYTPESLFKFSQTNNPADLIASADPIKVGSMRERMQGQNLIQEEWDGKKWNPVGSGPRFKPEGMEKPPAGYRWSADGRGLEAIPGGPALKPSAESQTQLTGIANTRSAISEYRDALKDFGFADAASPSKRATMGTKYNNMLLQAKEAYRLGVLNGPDYQILQEVITNPMSMRGLSTPNQALKAQADELDRILAQIEQNVTGVQSGQRRSESPGSAPPSAAPGRVIQYDRTGKRL